MLIISRLPGHDIVFGMIEYSLRELEAFVAVAEELSFTRAAARLRLAQPPLSRHIRTLEERLGVRLFERNNRSVALTAAGRTFYAEVREPLLRLQRAGAAAQRASAGETARLEIGFVSSLLSPELTELLREFRVAHPGIQLTLQDRIPAEQLQAIAEGRMDGGFVGLAPTQRLAGLRFIPWKREAVLLFVPNHHPRARERRVWLEAIAQEPMLAIASEAAPAFASKVQGLCRAAGFRPHVVQEASRAQAVVAMVAAGSGVAILPASVQPATGRAVTTLALRDKDATVTYVFAHRMGALPPALQQFIAAVAGSSRPGARKS
jgi:LysR family transcriptional regulator, benzoate and cis,cis-muconate-responsive activator of ben and cat genes